MSQFRIIALVLLLGIPGCTAETADSFAGGDPEKPAPGGTEDSPGGTLRVAVEVDRDGARLVTFSHHDREYIHGESRAERQGDVEVFQFILHHGDGERFDRELAIPGLCLDHAPEDPPHINGDTIELHRETVIVELPAKARASHVEVGHVAAEADGPRTLGRLALSPDKFDDAGTGKRYEELNLVPPPSPTGDAGATAEATAGTPPGEGGVTWPPTGQPTYKVYGDANQINERINVVIVPDGYKTTEKSTMETHAQNLVDEFNTTTPWKEHSKFFNYILVYAYSNDSGTTQCDCDILENTAMATFFPKSNPQCGNNDNRCLYYGSPPCNPGPNNIAAAEMRAPAHDTTIVMVNTNRYGGCGGARAVYSAANASARQIGLHELGHSLANLADEYGGNNSCGTSASNINTSTNSTQGAWPEWIADIGAPHESAQYYNQCIYRPESNCLMRALGQPLCHVCNQQWALRILGYPSVATTAVISGATPDPAQPITTTVNTPVDLSITTRFPEAPATNTITWNVTSGAVPCNSPAPPTTDSYTVSFSCSGTFNVTATATADTNFIKPQKYGANKKTKSWTVIVN